MSSLSFTKDSLLDIDFSVDRFFSPFSTLNLSFQYVQLLYFLTRSQLLTYIHYSVRNTSFFSGGFQDFDFIFGFHQFKYGKSGNCFLCVHPALGSLSFLKYLEVFPQFWAVFSYYCFKHFSTLSHCSSPLGVPISHILDHLTETPGL